MKQRVSMVAHARATDCRDANPEAIIAGIRDGRWREQVEAVRSARATDRKAAADKLKRQLPGVLWSGSFSRRANAGLISHSGQNCADIDNLDPLRLAELHDRFSRDPHVVAAFVSPSGTGLKVVFCVPADPALHAASFAAGALYVRDLAGVGIDATPDVARLCFVSYDPAATWRPDATELAPLIEPASPEPAADAPCQPSSTLPPSVEAVLTSGAQGGERNTRAMWLSCQLRDCGRSQAEARQLLAGYAARCTPPLASAEELRELDATIRSAYSRAPREPARSALPRVRIGGDLGTDQSGLADLGPDYSPPPLDPLPAVLQDYVIAAAESLNVDVGMVFVPFLAALASAIGNARIIELKPGFIQPPTTWASIIIRSGFIKSPALDLATDAILERERALRQANAEAVAGTIAIWLRGSDSASGRTARRAPPGGPKARGESDPEREPLWPAPTRTTAPGGLAPATTPA